jgi:hypothetical protein
VARRRHVVRAPRLYVHVHLADRLHRVHQHLRTGVVCYLDHLGDRQPRPVVPRDGAETDQARALDRVLHVVCVQVAPVGLQHSALDAVALVCGRPRQHACRMLQVRSHHRVVRLPVERARDPIHAVRRALRERDVRRVGAEDGRRRLTRRVERITSDRVRPISGWSLVLLALLEPRRRLDHSARARPARAGVHVDRVVQRRDVRAQLLRLHRSHVTAVPLTWFDRR